MKVYLVDGGDYDNYGWSGVYSSPEKAMAAYPLPEVSGIHIQRDRHREGGWQLEAPHSMSRGREWWNGWTGDFGYRIHEVEVDGEK